MNIEAKTVDDSRAETVHIVYPTDCNDLIKHLEDLKAKEEAAKLAREERAKARAKLRRKETRKGNKNVR